MDTSFRRALAISHRPAAALAALGLFWGAYSAWLPAVKERAGATDAVMGLVLLGAAVGNIAAMAAYPRMARRFGPRLLPGAAVMLALAAVAQLAGGVGPGIWGPLSLFAALALMGLAMSSLDVAANVRLSMLEAEHGIPLMNLAHGLYSLAFAVAAALSGLARGAGWAHAVVVGVVGGLMLLVALHLRGGRGPVAETAGGGERTPWAAVLPAALILFAAFIAENTTEMWSALHIERTLGGAAGEGAFGPAMMGLMMAAGRLSGQGLAARLGEPRLIVASSLIGIIGALMTAFAPSRSVAVLGIALIGIGVAVVVPSANSLLGRRVAPAQRPLAISRAWMLGFSGFFVGPVAMGWIAEGFSLRGGFVAVAGVIALIVVGLAALLRRPVRG